MNDTMTTRVGIGHNQGPATLADTLAERYGTFVRKADQVLAAARTVPLRVEDDDTAGSVADLAKAMRETEKAFEDAFEAEKAPHQVTITQIRGFFQTWLDKLTPERKRVQSINKDYTDRKAAEKRRLAEEEAQRKRLEAEKKQREARDAQVTAEAAKTALAEFARLEREAVEAKASAVSEQEQAAAQVAQCEAKLAKVKADNAALAAMFSKRVADGNPASDEERASKRDEADASLKAARADLDAARGLLTEARENARLAREAARKAENEAAMKAAEVRTAERTQKHATEEAGRNEKQAERLEAKAESDNPAMGSVRSIHGAVQTSQRVWQSEVIDRNLLDKEALWNLIHGDAIEVAVRKWMLNQAEDKREMPGARFWQESIAVIR